MKQCRECGTLSADDTVFCYICGTKFPENESEDMAKVAGIAAVLQYEESRQERQGEENLYILGMEEFDGAD